MVRPNPSETQIVQLLKERYGITMKEYKQLDGYDDKNYKITVDSCENKKIEKLHPHGYILKIINSLDSQDQIAIEGQNKIMFHLDEEGTRHIVRLLKYQLGSKLDDAKPCHEIYFNVGILTAKVDNCLSTFYHPGCERPDFKWGLKNAMGILDFVDVIKDSERRIIVKQTMEDFKNNVLSEMKNLEKGIIHGDINEHNILLDGNEISALIDFGDVNYAPFILETASALCYMLIHSGEISFGKSFLEGYFTIRKMPELEIKLLKTCISARLCQSLVMGAHSALDDPTNEYILSTQKNGWLILEKLYTIANQDLIDMWFK